MEFQRYLSELYLSRGEDLLTYWASRGRIYPNLIKTAKKYLHMPATSVPCEWFLSKAGEVVSHKRSRLKPRSQNASFFKIKTLTGLLVHLIYISTRVVYKSSTSTFHFPTPSIDAVLRYSQQTSLF